MEYRSGRIAAGAPGGFDLRALFGRDFSMQDYRCESLVFKSTGTVNGEKADFRLNLLDNAQILRNNLEQAQKNVGTVRQAGGLLGQFFGIGLDRGTMVPYQGGGAQVTPYFGSGQEIPTNALASKAIDTAVSLLTNPENLIIDRIDKSGPELKDGDRICLDCFPQDRRPATLPRLMIAQRLLLEDVPSSPAHSDNSPPNSPGGSRYPD